jgi:hypothetical protein
MSPPVPPDPDRGSADAPLDDVDAAILDDVRAMHDRLDPPPADLNDRVKFAIRLADSNIEISRLLEDTLVTAATRTVDGVRAITFESPILTIMIMVTNPGPGHVRLEGWLAPPGPWRVALRLAGVLGGGDGPTFEVPADHTGRFVFEDIRSGLAQLIVQRDAAGQPPTARLVTSALRL